MVFGSGFSRKRHMRRASIESEQSKCQRTRIVLAQPWRSQSKETFGHHGVVNFHASLRRFNSLSA
jgi:hypothetical protein